MPLSGVRHELDPRAPIGYDKCQARRAMAEQCVNPQVARAQEVD